MELTLIEESVVLDEMSRNEDFNNEVWKEYLRDELYFISNDVEGRYEPQNIKTYLRFNGKSIKAVEEMLEARSTLFKLYNMIGVNEAYNELGVCNFQEFKEYFEDNKDSMIYNLIHMLAEARGE